MSNEIIYLTAEGMNKLKEELQHMVSVERPAAAAAIAEARDKGDLSENAEYDAAREAQGLLEMRIAQLEQTLTKARIIDETKIDTSKVQILSRVKLLNHNVKREVETPSFRRTRQTCARVSSPSAHLSLRRCLARRSARLSRFRFPQAYSSSRF